MHRSPRRLLLILSALLLAGFSAAPTSIGQTPAGLEDEQAAVRLRKLHLVRPDLILYPIAHEIYC